jgi:DNA ligase-1
MEDGTRFSIGTGFSDAERSSPPPLGAIATFRYQELSDGGVPRFPSSVGVRHDIVLRTASVPEPAAKPQDPPAAAAMKRRFELSDGSSNKFWEVELRDADQTVRFGRVGTAGQTKSKTFPDVASARDATEALVREKTSKGYVEVA